MKASSVSSDPLHRPSSNNPRNTNDYRYWTIDYEWMIILLMKNKKERLTRAYPCFLPQCWSVTTHNFRSSSWWCYPGTLRQCHRRSKRCLSCKWRHAGYRFSCTWGCLAGPGLTIRRRQGRAHSQGRCITCLNAIILSLFSKTYAFRLAWWDRLSKRGECTRDFRIFLVNLQGSTLQRSPSLMFLGLLLLPSKTLFNIFAVS